MSIVEIAQGELALHVREETGKNDGKEVEKYQRTVQLLRGDPWCAAFVAWCAKQANGGVMPRWTSGSVATMWIKSEKLCHRVHAGAEDAYLIVEPGWVWCRAIDREAAKKMRTRRWTRGHTGIVVAVDDEGFDTIEGNTNEAGSREGDGVYLKRHLWSDCGLSSRTVGWFHPIIK
jgi:hypothetical protein